MKIAIDARTAIGQKAGKGFVTENLILEILAQDKKNDYYLLSDQPLKLHLPRKLRRVIISKPSLLWHFAALREIKKLGIDLFIAPGSYLIPAFCRMKNLKIILIVHDLVAFLFPAQHQKKATIIERLTLKRAAKRADQIITISEATKKDLVRLYPDVKKKTQASLISFNPHFKNLRLKKGKFFLFIGTLEPRKNISNMIKAYSLLPEKIRRQYPFYLVGKKGWYYQGFFDLTKELGLEKQVQFLGYLPNQEVVKMMNKATVFLFPSLYEGFGMPILEAQNCGTPVITSGRSSMKEIAGDSALLVNPENPKDIARQMRKLVGDSRLRQKLNKAGIKNAKKYSWKKFVKPFVDIIRRYE